MPLVAIGVEDMWGLKDIGTSDIVADIEQDLEEFLQKNHHKQALDKHKDLQAE